MTFSKEEARIKIAKLVEDFRAHETTLEKAAEAQIENNFIRPLFRYLNWNTENEGLSHAHYEFKVQVTNKKGLRPDYILNLDGRDVLVMDAKQVKYSMKDPRWLYQVYSYAYSTQNSKPSEKMDFAILTDFQEFIVLDCTLFAAKPEAVNNFRVIDWTYNDYVDKFDELWELFERNNVLNDSLPHVIASRSLAKQSVTDEGIASGQSAPLAKTSRGLWSRYLSPQKVKANRISPDKAFLAEMDDEKTGWRVLLAKDMKKRNPSADGELITAAVQLLIDRLIFIKALSDREVDKDYLAELAKVVEENGLADNDTGWFKACKNIFDELNNFYNGSIFQERRELENIIVSNKVVRSVITDLQPENSPYNFAVLPVEILGTIYERFLGRVVRTTDKQVKIEEKPEVRKAGGVYYTPQYIVDYIVENTLGKLLEDCKTPIDVSKLKILDPACGSGSFLLGAYSKLIEWHKDYFARAGKEKRDRESFYKDESGGIRLTAKLKREILKNNLFGVDIDPQAVEVTRFSLSLKALEDLREGELTEERSLFHQTVLPDLSQNIKNGNSLIGSDYFAGQLMPDIEEMKTIKGFDWKSEFSEIFQNGGFDVVIGNPPYGIVFKEEIKPYLENRYPSFVRNNDTYTAFTEKCLYLLREEGQFGFIIPNTYLLGPYFDTLKTKILSLASVQEVIDFGTNSIFEQPNVFTGLLFFEKKNLPNATSSRFAKVLDVSSFPNGIVFTEINTDVLQSLRWSPVNPIVAKTLSTNVKLASLAWVKDVGLNYWTQGRGKTRGGSIADRVMYDGEKQNQNDKPYLKGRDIERYAIKFGNHWLRHDYKNMLDPKVDTLRFSSEFLEREKIVYRQTADHPIASLDQSKILTDKTVHVIVLHQELESTLNLRYLLGILNSQLLNYIYKSVAQEEGRTFAQVKIFRIKELPIRTIDFTDPAEKSQHEKMVVLVSQMLELHKSRAGAKTQSETDVYARQIKSVDESIDTLVYELYGLTEEEIKIVEGK